MQEPIHEEIKPLSEFPKTAASFLDKVHGEPKVLVYADEPARGAVLLDLTSYRQMKDELALLRDIHQANREIDAGSGVPHAKALNDILTRLQ